MSSRAKRDNQIREEINSIPNLKLYAKEESVDFKGKKFNVINVYAEGWIRGDTDVKFTGKVSLSLIDKTPGSGELLLPLQKDTVKSYFLIFTIRTLKWILDLTPTGILILAYFLYL